LFPSHFEEMIGSILIEVELKVTVKSEDNRGGYETTIYKQAKVCL
jgi:hypothetical protein